MYINDTEERLIIVENKLKHINTLTKNFIYLTMLHMFVVASTHSLIKEEDTEHIEVSGNITYFNNIFEQLITLSYTLYFLASYCLVEQFI